MDYLQSEPSAAIAGVVRSLWLVRGTAQHRLERIFPMPFVHVIVNLSGPYRATDPLSGITVEPLTGVFCSGLQSHFTLSENPSTLFNLGAILEPDAVGRLGLDPAAITGRVMNVAADLPGLAQFREAALAEADPDAGALLEALDAALVLSLRDDTPDPVVRRAVTVLTEQPSRSVASVASECELSHKSLIDRFRRATGVTPKFFATVVRFHRLIDELPLGEDVPWAALAAATGYYDQSHVIRTFKAFTGFTPQDYYRIARTQGRESARFVPVG
ncbi:MAG: AraC family transcriptional regulator [Mycetocola sp.]